MPSIRLDDSQPGIGTVNEDPTVSGNQITGAATTTDNLTFLVTGDTVGRLVVNADGALEWGAGGASAVDCSLARSGVGSLTYTAAAAATDLLFKMTNAAVGGGTWQLNSRNDGKFWISKAGVVDPFTIDNAGQLALTVQGSTGGLLIGTDANLYRSAANTLATDDDLFVRNGTSEQIRIGTTGTGNAQIRFGDLQDTNLYRSAANTLKTDDGFDVAGAVSLATYGGVGSAYLTGYANTGTMFQFTGGSIVAENRTTTTNVAFKVKGMASQSGDLQQWQDSAGVIGLAVDATGGKLLFGPSGAQDTNLYRSAAGTLKTDGSLVVVGDLTLSASDIISDTTTGTKFGTATTQKIGFYNATPVVQGASVADATDAASAITQLNALISRIEATGLIATV